MEIKIKKNVIGNICVWSKQKLSRMEDELSRCHLDCFILSAKKERPPLTFSNRIVSDNNMRLCRTFSVFRSTDNVTILITPQICFFFWFEDYPINVCLKVSLWRDFNWTVACFILAIDIAVMKHGLCHWIELKTTRETGDRCDKKLYKTIKTMQPIW